MEFFYSWLIIVGSVLVAFIGNLVSVVWVSKENKYHSSWFFLLIAVSIVVFITFGLTSQLVGLSVGTSIIDSSIPALTILAGLLIFKEIKNLSAIQICGLCFTLTGIVLVNL